MDEAVSAQAGFVVEGPVRVEDGGLRGMITVKGDLSDAALQRAATELAGVDFPGRGEARVAGARGICWMAPDEILILLPYADVAAGLGTLIRALEGHHCLVADVSDARCVFVVSGEGSRDVMGKLTPADLSPDRFGPGQFRRTRLAQVAAAFWMSDEQTFQIICFRSVSGYVADLLRTAAHPGGEVGFHRAGRS